MHDPQALILLAAALAALWGAQPSTSEGGARAARGEPGVKSGQVSG